MHIYIHIHVCTFTSDSSKEKEQLARRRARARLNSARAREEGRKGEKEKETGVKGKEGDLGNSHREFRRSSLDPTGPRNSIVYPLHLLGEERKRCDRFKRALRPRRTCSSKLYKTRLHASAMSLSLCKRVTLCTYVLERVHIHINPRLKPGPRIYTLFLQIFLDSFDYDPAVTNAEFRIVCIRLPHAILIYHTKLASISNISLHMQLHRN